MHFAQKILREKTLGHDDADPPNLCTLLHAYRVRCIASFPAPA